MNTMFKKIVGYVVGASMFALPAVSLAAVPADFGLVEGDVIRAENTLDVFIVNEHGYKRLFVNPEIFNIYGHLGFDKVKEVSAATADAFPTSGLFRNCEAGGEEVYGLEMVSDDVANLHWVDISGAEAVAQDSNFFKKVFCINNAEQALYGVGSAYTSLGQVSNYNPGEEVAGGDETLGFDPNGGSQGAIESWDLGSPDEDEVVEGQSNVEVYEVEIDLDKDDGPLMLTSADIWFEEDETGASDKPWDFFKEVSLWLNEKEIANSSADSSSDWSDDDTGNLPSAGGDEYRIRFNGLTGVLADDDTNDLTVQVSMVNNIDTEDEGAVWNIGLGNHRVLDESGFQVTENEDLEDSFSVKEEDVADLEIRDASDEVDARVIEVSETSNTNGEIVHRFTVEEMNGVDLMIEDLMVEFDVVGADANDVIKTAYLFRGSKELGSESVPASGEVLFEDIDVDVDGDSEEDWRIEVDLRDNDEGDRYPEGTTLAVAVTDGDFRAEDEFGNDEDEFDFDIDSESEVHELRTVGFNVELIDVSFSKDSESSPNLGTALFEFEVTAFGGDIFIDADGGDHDVSIDGTTDSEAYSLTSSADEEDESFFVGEGDTESFNLAVAITPDGSGFFTLSLDGISYDFDDVNGTELFEFGLDDFETNPLYLVD